MSGHILLRDSSSAGRAYIFSKLFREHKKILGVFESSEESLIIFQDLKALGYESVFRFSDDVKEISQVLTFLYEKADGVILTDKDSLSLGISSPSDFADSFSVVRHQKISPQELMGKLLEFGFERVEFVFERGKFSLRGAVLDIWDFVNERPVRINFGVSRAEEIKFFDTFTQLSTGKTKNFKIFGNPSGKKKLRDFIKKFFLLVHPDTVKTAKNNLRECILTPSGADTGVRRAPVYSGNLDFFLKDIESFEKNNFTVRFFCDNEEAQSYLEGIISSKTNLKANYSKTQISGGIVSWTDRFAALKSSEIFGFGAKFQEEKPPPRGKIFKKDIVYRKNDVIVHEDYGIGRFIKLSQFVIKGKPADYISICYLDGTAHIPLEEFSKLHRYRAPSGVRPVLSRLGTKDFSRKKEKVYRETFEMAKEILKVNARRRVVKGVSFGSFPAEKNFAGQFPYEETNDQVEAIRRILREMEDARPMDHLLCGDVGYGKTEVAMRAAFRTCWNGYQVICIAPTTVLAQQHYFVFMERFRNFPVRIEMLSRFTSAKKKEILQNLKDGKTDILISTHAAFNEKVEFARPGLLILDEEHRFGVRQKEIMKKRFPSIDVLSMSATPIPRTLSMALSKILSFSIIESPPPGRTGIETFVGPFKKQMLKEAVMREIARNGQVFYVFNRISAIKGIYGEFREMFPHLRVEVAHAKMPSGKLSLLMRDFASGKFDVLLSTIIIQSGLDIPNVNTLVIRNSEALGLAQMYQLRGRIGRGVRKAFCYFFYSDISRGSARKRFELLQEFGDLSSGFRLAMADMELRGAGNVFGPQQHGYIKTVGTELYFKLLEKAIYRVKGLTMSVACEIKFISGGRFIPAGYVSSQDERFRLYIRLSRLSDIFQLRRFEEELVDRFGAPPPNVRRLLGSVELKVLATKRKIGRIEETPNGFILAKGDSSKFFSGNLESLVKELT